MQLSDLNYSYPPELVALHPLRERDASRMMVLDREKREKSHRFFKDFPSFFSKGDILVLNDSKVFPCRLLTKKKTGGSVEILLIREVTPSVWECLVSDSKKISKGTEFIFSDQLKGEITNGSDEVRQIKLFCEGEILSILAKIGHTPLPPYIKRKEEPVLDQERYQTIYAEKVGSVAAPTAGFHFSSEIMRQLKDRGVQICFITLHVGIGTFLPIRVSQLKDHQMHGEYYEISTETAEAVRRAKQDGRSVSVVGTTAVRALESAWDPSSVIREGRGYTEKFIYPPYEFKIVDRLLTNFHQPKSTLLALVSAFAGGDFILDAYGEAITRKYRLFSYGDCMLIM